MHSIIEEFYTNKDNMKMEYSESDLKVCAIYFSSNGLYYPDHIEAIKSTLIEKDKYEWYKTRVSCASKHIFVRDVYKQWYVKGVNRRCNDLTKLSELLKKETEGYEIITIGTSSGGYAAVLLGIVLNVKYILCFSPQFSLQYYYEQNKLESIRIVNQYKDDNKRNLYYDLVPYIKNSNVKIFYFVPEYCKQDSYQYSLVKDFPNIYCFRFKTKYHGTAMYNFNVKYILNRNLDELLELYNRYKGKIINKNIFAINCYGIIKGSIFIFKEIKSKIVIRLSERRILLKNRKKAFSDPSKGI